MAYKWDGVYQTKNVGLGTNTIKYIVIHHTGAIGEGNLKVLLGKTDRQVSCHFYIDQKGKAYKLADPKQITYHAGVSRWGDIQGLNTHSLGIEVEGPPFTKAQFDKVCDLVKYLRATFNIPVENVLRHCDLTWEGSTSKKLWDGKSKTRKVDIDRSLWADRGIPNFETFRTKYL